MLIVALFFILLRFVTYVGWCFAGAAVCSRAGRRSWLRFVVVALCLGALRVLLGLFVQYGIFDATGLLPFMRLREELLWSYLAVVVPVRLLMWLVVLLVTRYLLRKTEARPKETWLKWGLAWVLGGTLLSCLLDVPMMGLEHSFSR